MQILFLLIIGVASGFLATRLLRVEADPLTTAAIGVLGTVLGLAAVRLLLAGVTVLGALAAAFLGALALAWAWRRYRTGR